MLAQAGHDRNCLCLLLRLNYCQQVVAQPVQLDRVKNNNSCLSLPRLIDLLLRKSWAEKGNSGCSRLSTEFTVFNQVMSLFLQSASGSVFTFCWEATVQEFKPDIYLQVLLLLS